jgi:hypothetical protein
MRASLKLVAPTALLCVGPAACSTQLTSEDDGGLTVDASTQPDVTQVDGPPTGDSAVGSDAGCEGGPAGMYPPPPPNLCGGWSTDPYVWPNVQSQAAGDPWIVAHHDSLTKMRPQVLVLNFVDGLTRDALAQHIAEIFAGLNAGSQYHGYLDGGAPAFLDYQLLGIVDLTDDTTGATPSTETDQPIATCPNEQDAGYSHCNSTLLPRKSLDAGPDNGDGGDRLYLDVSQLFDASFKKRLGFRNPEHPEQFVDLCTMLTWGWVDEVWSTADNDLNLPPGKVDNPEDLEIRRVYVEDGGFTGTLSRCGGNGCFEADDFAKIQAACPALQSFKLIGVNHVRGPGCKIHALGHGIEGQRNTIPAFGKVFKHFANFDLDRFGPPWTTLGWSTWYDLNGSGCDQTSCAGGKIDYPTDNSVEWSTTRGDGGVGGSMNPFNQGCGNVHFPPNAMYNYDYKDMTSVLSTCEHYGLHDGPDGGDLQEPFTSQKTTPYAIYNDCGGPWEVYWRQSFPGLGNTATDSSGKPMRNWWPYLFY